MWYNKSKEKQINLLWTINLVIKTKDNKFGKFLKILNKKLKLKINLTQSLLVLIKWASLIKQILFKVKRKNKLVKINPNNWWIKSFSNMKIKINKSTSNPDLINKNSIIIIIKYLLTIRLNYIKLSIHLLQKGYLIVE